MRSITLEELKEKQDRGDNFKLVMALGEWHFRAAHIPGSISVGSAAEAAEKLKADDEIVVYRTDRACPASKVLCRTLEEAGYGNVGHYADGIFGWGKAGYRLEGEQVNRRPATPSSP